MKAGQGIPPGVVSSAAPWRFDVAYLMAILVSEPFQLRPWEIAELTDAQIYGIYLYPRDDNGALKKRNEVPEKFQSLEEKRSYFFAMGTSFGIPPAELQRQWDEKHGES